VCRADNVVSAILTAARGSITRVVIRRQKDMRSYVVVEEIGSFSQGSLHAHTTHATPAIGRSLAHGARAAHVWDARGRAGLARGLGAAGGPRYTAGVPVLRQQIPSRTRTRRCVCVCACVCVCVLKRMSLGWVVLCMCMPLCVYIFRGVCAQ
jgi:hypothetical protein